MNTPIDITGITLTTKRLILRPWKKTDLEDFFEYAHVDGVGQMAGWLPHKNTEESQGILSRFIEGKHVFAIEYQGKVIGSLGIEAYREDIYPEFDPLQGRELGYVLSKAYWGQGIMPEAVQRVIRWLFDEIGLDFIMVGHFDFNIQSRRVIEKCGFRYLKSRPYETRFQTTETCLEYILYKPERSEKQ